MVANRAYTENRMKTELFEPGVTCHFDEERGEIFRIDGLNSLERRRFLTSLRSTPLRSK